MEQISPYDEKRRAFVEGLHRLHWEVASENPRLSGEARRTLARLRRSLSGPAQQVEAYEFVLAHDPPEHRQELWALFAGLFALHPCGKDTSGRSIGGAMRLLGEEYVSAQRRFTHLLSLDKRHFRHYLRQAFQLLCAGDVAIDYHRLLTDLEGVYDGGDRAHKVRLQWARDYYRPYAPNNGRPQLTTQR